MDPIWANDWSHSPFIRWSPNWGFLGVFSAVRQMPGDLFTAFRIISLSPLLATDVTDATLGTSGLWLETRTGAGVTATLTKSFFGCSPWLHGLQVNTSELIPGSNLWNVPKFFQQQFRHRWEDFSLFQFQVLPSSHSIKRVRLFSLKAFPPIRFIHSGGSWLLTFLTRLLRLTHRASSIKGNLSTYGLMMHQSFSINQQKREPSCKWTAKGHRTNDL
jgi:hypothetical protein